MFDGGELDVESLSKLVKWQIDSGTDGIVAAGTTGESPVLEQDEWEQVVKTCITVSSKMVPVIAGCGTNCTKTTIEKTRRAKELGADGAMIVTPYYNRPTQEGLFQHYMAITSAVPDFPIILYNVPSRTGCDLLPSTVARLSQLDSIVGVKDASGSNDRIPDLISLSRPGFRVFTGDDGLALDAISKGANGVISVAGNVNPELMSKMVAAALKKDTTKAKRLDDGMSGLYDKLFIEPNPVPSKWLLSHMKRIHGGIRLPLVCLSIDYHEELQTAYSESVRCNASN